MSPGRAINVVGGGAWGTALANAAATPVQVAARAETSSTSSGSVPQVTVRGNGTRFCAQ